MQLNKKTKDNLITAIFVIAVLGGVFYLANKYGGNTNEGQAITPIKNSDSAENTGTFFDFGTISMKNGKVSALFKFTNEEETAIKINKVYTSCMCTEAKIYKNNELMGGPYGMPGHSSPYSNINIASSESIDIEAVFDPAAHGPSGTGLIERVVYLETDSKTKPKLEYNIKAVVTK